MTASEASTGELEGRSGTWAGEGETRGGARATRGTCSGGRQQAAAVGGR